MTCKCQPYPPPTPAACDGARVALTAAAERLTEARELYDANAGDLEFRMLCGAAVDVDRARRRLNAMERELTEASV